MSDPLEEARVALEAAALPPNDGGVVVKVFVGEEPVVEADRGKLERRSEFFRALYSFGEGQDDDLVDLSCDVSPATLRWIIRAIDSDDPESASDIDSFPQAYEILRGSAYLQCELAESLTGKFIVPRLDLASCFTAAIKARENGCSKLYQQIEEYALKRLTTQVLVKIVMGHSSWTSTLTFIGL